MTAPADFGGQAMPKVMEIACFDMFQSANMAFSLGPTLTLGAIEAIHVHGTEAQKSLYLPKLISGEWTGTMNLTEPQAGTDLAALTTRAESDGNGRYRLTGQKIFITWGDHPATSNIIHLVLARLPDAPAGTKGISLFICSKFKLTDQGTPSVHNTVKVAGLEHKLGIHGSPTCVMAFEGADAELIGQPNQGLVAMFTMMNAARLAVGVQGVGQADGAFQKAVEYAQDRRQGRSLITGQDNAPIFDHPDVRLSLGIMKAKLDAARAICLLTAASSDHAHMGGDEAAYYKRREDLLVPIAKAFSTDIGVEVASSGLQIHGGMGFIEETGAAQYYRDARIAPIYEGTNGIQALDLIGRKLGSDGKPAVELTEEIRDFIQNNRLNSPFKSELALLGSVTDSFVKTTQWIVANKATHMTSAATGATQYLRMAGELIGGWLLLKSAIAALHLMDEGHADTDWLSAKISVMRIYCTQILSRTSGLMVVIQAGADDLMALTPRAFE